MQVVAPGKTPRGASDRVKTDRKDAELLARCLLAGSLHPIVVPPVEVEAARELTRCHDACRRDLMNARHRASKMLLRHGRVYPKATTWSQEHRRWLARQQFSQPASELTYANLIAQVDGLTARKHALAERLSEVGDRRAVVADRRPPADVPWRRHPDRALDPSRARGRLAPLPESAPRWVLARVDPIAQPVRRVLPAGRDHQDRIHSRPPTVDRVSVALRPRAEDRRDTREPPTRTARARPAIANRAQHRLHHVYVRMRARGKPHHVTVVAVARELACFLWAAATAPSPHLKAPPGSGGRGAGPIKRPGTRESAMSNTIRCHARP